jgi:small GTP-binding protein
MKAKPIKVAVLGQSGVGKSSTVNNLFGAKFKVSRTGEGTTEQNFVGYVDYELPDGSIITVADLPGYGRKASTDETYKKMYIDALKDVDIILLIIQANDKAIVDDIEMVQCLYEWSKEGLILKNE